MQRKILITALIAIGLSLSGVSHAVPLSITKPDGTKTVANVEGNKLMLRDATGKLWIPAGDGAYKTNDGKTIIVKGGIIAAQSGSSGPPRSYVPSRFALPIDKEGQAGVIAPMKQGPGKPLPAAQKPSASGMGSIGGSGMSQMPGASQGMGKPGINKAIGNQIGGRIGAVPGRIEMPAQGIGSQQGGRASPGGFGMPGQNGDSNRQGGASSGGISMPGQGGDNNRRGGSGGISMPGQGGDNSRQGSSGSSGAPGRNGGETMESGGSGGSSGFGIPGRGGDSNRRGGSNQSGGFSMGPPQVVTGGTDKGDKKPGDGVLGAPVDSGDKDPKGGATKPGASGGGDNKPKPETTGGGKPEPKGEPTKPTGGNDTKPEPKDKPDKEPGGKPDKKTTGTPNESGSGSSGGGTRPRGRVGGSIVNPGRGESGGSNSGEDRRNMGNNPVTNPDVSRAGGGRAPGGGVGQLTQPVPGGTLERP